MKNERKDSYTCSVTLLNPHTLMVSYTYIYILTVMVHRRPVMPVGASLLANPTASSEVPTLGTVRTNREQARSYRAATQRCSTRTDTRQTNPGQERQTIFTRVPDRGNVKTTKILRFKTRIPEIAKPWEISRLCPISAASSALSGKRCYLRVWCSWRSPWLFPCVVTSI